MSIGDFLKQIRMEHGLTQAQMGDVFFRNKDYVYLIENDKATPSAKELYILSEKLEEPILKILMYGISLDEMMEVQKQK